MNVLLITSDQQHWNTVGAFNREIHTPNIDRLVNEGTTFTRAYCPNPTCTPTRASIITGKFPSQHGAWALGTKLPESEETVGDVFSSGGYKTALIGKAHFQPLVSTDEFPGIEARPTLWDYDFWKGFNGPYYGFEHVELLRGHTNEADVGMHYALWMEEKGCENWRDYFLPPTGNMSKDEKHTWNIPEEFHYDAWIAERTNAMLDDYKQNDQPFFLWASFPDPHPAYYIPKPWDTMYDQNKLTIPHCSDGEHDRNPQHYQMTQQEKPDYAEYHESGQALFGLHSHLHNEDELRKDTAIYYGMTSMMDKYIGEILNRLDELDLADNTVVIFTSDHGHFLGHHGLIAKGPFHYEDMIKVPFIVRCPGLIPQGKITDELQSLVDLSPSMLSLCGLPVPRTMTGIDQSQLWSGKAVNVRNHIICENHYDPTTVHLKTYVNKRYKITVYYNQEYGELFDLEKDPKEVMNLWDDPSYSQVKSDMLLQFLWGEMGKEPMWMPRIYKA